MIFSHLNLISLASTSFYVFLGIVGIGLLIGFHELGHFFFARLFNVDVPSFSLGFGPSLFKKKIGGTVYKISAVPLGGYVEVAGMAEVGQGEQKEALRRDSRSFSVKPYYQKMLILFGGIMFNLIFAYVCLILLFALGVPKSPLLLPLNTTTTLESVTPEGAAARAGLQAGDTITKVNNQDVDVLKLLEKIQENSGKEVVLTLLRNGQEMTLPVKIDGWNPETKTRGRLGVGFAMKDIAPRGLPQAVKEGISATNQLIKVTVRGLVTLVKSRSTEGAGGPIMIINQIMHGAQQGFKVWLLLLVLISINLAILNLIPLPIVDGGQILFYSIEALFRRPLPENVRLGIHYVSWILIMILIVYLSFKDLKVLLNGFFTK
jgi:regulator of sigma E protease